MWQENSKSSPLWLTVYEIYYQMYHINLYIGDCCLPSINCDYGNECICHEDGTRHPEDSCHSWLIGDGICDDFNNREICLYDEGNSLIWSEIVHVQLPNLK